MQRYLHHPWATMSKAWAPQPSQECHGFHPSPHHQQRHLRPLQVCGPSPHHDGSKTSSSKGLQPRASTRHEETSVTSPRQSPTLLHRKNPPSVGKKNRLSEEHFSLCEIRSMRPLHG